MFADTPTRMKIDLSGRWEFTLDGRTWGSVLIPSAYDFSGKMTFQREFDIKSEMLDKYAFSLVIYGINYHCEISINGNFVGRHIGGYNSFVVPIPGNTLQIGKENAIRIVVDNELDPRTTLPLKKQVGRWRTYGGIFRDIYLLATPKLHIESVTVGTEISRNGESAKISINGAVTDRWSGLKSGAGTVIGIEAEIFDKLTGESAGRSGVRPITYQVNKTISADFDFQLLSPKLWSFDTPDLYLLRCRIVSGTGDDVVVVDEYDLDIGVRDLRWTDGRLLLNGAPQYLKGILWQEDHPELGSAMTYEALERDVASIKSLGANLIRFQYPPHPYMLNLCDRYGLFVVEDVPMIDVPVDIFVEEYYQEIASASAKEMVERDRNHVSVIAWGIGDEVEASSSEACEFVNVLRNIIKSLDNRSVYLATGSVKNSCLDYIDVIAVNAGGGDPKTVYGLLKEYQSRFGEKPIFVGRYGRGVEPGNHNGYSDPVSAESQARYIMQFYNTIKDLKIAGSVLWSYNDWRTDRPSLAARSHDPYLNTEGIVSYEREKRTAYDVVRSLFNGEKVQALPVGNYSSNAPIIFVVAGFFVLISFAFLYNAHRRFRDSVNRSLFRTYNFFADVRDQRILSYTQSIFLGLIISVTWATILSSILTHYRNDLLLDNLLSQLISDGIKEWLIGLIWNPFYFILVVSAIIFLKLIVLTFAVIFLSLMVKARVYYYHAFSITMWSMLPFIVLIPVSMILFRLMETQFYIIPVFIVLGILSAWVFFRLLKGISIIFDIFPAKIYFFSIFLIVVMGAAVYGYLDYSRSTTLYIRYLLQTMNN